MDGVWVANKRFKSALDSFMAQAEEQDEKERRLNKRLAELDRKKAECAEEYGNPEATGEDMVKINVGGKIVRAKRSTLTQLKGTKFEWLFSGRWDKKLPNDKEGLIFLDVDPTSFRSIVDYLNALAISSDDDPPEIPGLKDDDCSIQQYLDFFGLSEHILLGIEMPDSEIIKDVAQFKIVKSWLSEDDSDGQFSLLYRSSRDGLSDEKFHSNCDAKGSTLTIIETKKGLVVGGYSNISWESVGGYKNANKAFVFCLTDDGKSPTKMKLKRSEGKAVEHTSKFGPVFGCGSHDTLYVEDSRLSLFFCEGRGSAYDFFSEGPDRLVCQEIKNMEVFGIERTGQCLDSTPLKHEANYVSQDINCALERKIFALNEAEQNISTLEDDFEKERKFINSMAGCDEGDVVVLDVSGTIMATNRSTLRIIDDSVLARQFDESVWTEQGNRSKSTNEWTPDDVEKWVKNISGIPEGVSDLLKQKAINGPQLLALGIDGLERIIGPECIGAVYLLHNKIRKLQAENEQVLIDHSPYCFGKILDFLRLKRLHSLGLVTEPSLPVVHNSKRDMFVRVVRYYFPGETSKCILG